MYCHGPVSFERQIVLLKNLLVLLTLQKEISPSGLSFCFSAFSPLDFVLHDFSPSSILGDLVFLGLLQLIYTFGSQPFLWKCFNANHFICAVTTSNRPNIGQCWIFTGLIRLLSTEAKIYCILFGVKSLGISVIFLKSPVTYIAKTIRGRTSNI